MAAAAIRVYNETKDLEFLKEAYPNATFKAVYTGLDWDTVLKHECYEIKKV